MKIDYDIELQESWQKVFNNPILNNFRYIFAFGRMTVTISSKNRWDTFKLTRESSNVSFTSLQVGKEGVVGEKYMWEMKAFFPIFLSTILSSLGAIHFISHVDFHENLTWSSSLLKSTQSNPIWFQFLKQRLYGKFCVKVWGEALFLINHYTPKSVLLF